MKLTLQFVESVLGPSKVATSIAGFREISSDSRKIQNGDLFVAIKGDQFDGHDFVTSACEKGATGVLVSRDVEVPKNVAKFLVRDVLESYRKLAGVWRERFKVPVVAIGGSVGKTTTKDLTAAILSGKFKKVLKTTGSQNGFVGIPMTLFEFETANDAAVIEIGIDDIQAMEKHADLVLPDVSCITAISEEHLEFLKNIETVAEEEIVLLKKTAENGKKIIVNLDDPWVHKSFDMFPKNLCVTVSLRDPSAHVFGRYDHGKITVSGFSKEQESFSSPLPGEHNASNFLCALGIAKALGLNSDEVRRGMTTYKGSAGRSQVERLKNGATVLCDFYNASPASMAAAFRTLDDLAKGASKQKIFCLGDMLELGEGEENFHRDLAKKLPKDACFILYGTRMKWLASEMKKLNFEDFLHVDSLEKAAKKVIEKLTPKSCVLIKGSNSMRLGTVWEKLKANF